MAHDGFLGLNVALNAVNDPLEHAGVLAEARPQEAAVVATAEPVNQEDRRHAVAALFTHIDPVLQVVTGVVAHERKHSHRIVAQGADAALCCSGLARGQQGTDHGAVVPVKGLGYQRNGGLAAAAEEDGVDLHALPIVVLRSGARALGNRDAVTRVRVRSLSGGGRSPILTGPVDEVLWCLLGHFLPPDIAVVGQRNVGENGVARLHGLHGNRVGVVVGARGHAEETIFRVYGIKAVLAQVQPGNIVTDDLGLPTRNGRGNHGQVGLAACRREGGRNVVLLTLWVGELQDEHVLSHPAFFLSHDRSDAQRVALLRQDGVAAVAGTIGPDFLGPRELGDVLGVIAWPRHIFLAWL